MAGESKGAFALCTVTSAEILDQNYQRTEPIVVSQPTTAYVRVIDPSHAGSTYELNLKTTRSDGTTLTPNTPTTLVRIGVSSTFISAFTLLPEHYPASPKHTGTSADMTMESAALGEGNVEATASAGPPASRGTKFPGAVRVRFFRRDVPDRCFIESPFPGEEVCPLTPAPDQSTPPGTVQETAIRVGYVLGNTVFFDACPSGQTCTKRLHMEAVGLLADVVNPEDVKAKKLSPQVDSSATGTLKFLEIPNSAYLDNENSNQPARFFRERYFDSGIPISGGDLTNPSEGRKNLTLTSGRATFRLYSVAPPRFDAGGSHPVLWTQGAQQTPQHISYTTTLKVGIGAVPSLGVTFQDDGILNRPGNPGDRFS